MQLSNREKKRRKSEKELNSFRNKMGSNIVWFDSLSKTKQYDLLFGWKKIKFRNTITKPEYRKVAKRIPIDPQRPWGRKKLVQVMELKYPPSLKHFIKECRESRLYKPMIQNLRQTTIDIILNEK